MPWKECHVQNEPLPFVARLLRLLFCRHRLLDGEKMTTVCAAFGISRKTGYKIYKSYRDDGVHGLTARSRDRTATPTSSRSSSKCRLSGSRSDYPDWGAPKITERLRERCGP
jgi:putative transposase